MKIKLVAVTIFAALILAACSGETTNEVSNSTEKETQNIKELVNDYSVGNKNAMKASITSTELTITNADKTEEVYELPEDEFFVSIAPYINETHP